MSGSDLNRLWVTVSCLGEGNLFASYPKLLASMMEGQDGVQRGPPDFELLLPSNTEWQTKIYYQLVENQKNGIGMTQPSAFMDRPRSAGPWDTTLPQPPAKRPRRCILASASLTSRVPSSPSVASVTWNVSDISKAAGLLTDPPRDVEFGDEQEMRRVYSLVYDVFRYRNVLNQALADVQFFYLFPELESKSLYVLLLLYDLYHRRFAEREHSDGSAKDADNLFPAAGLSVPEAALWATRVRLAAAMSRLRIAHSALKLSDMLPNHLRDERIIKAVQVAPVMCWVNKNLLPDDKTPNDMFEEIRKTMNLQAIPSEAAKLGPFDLRWDPLCPMFLAFHYSQRTDIAQSPFVRKNILIMQNRSFCFGPAIFCKLLLQHNLTGSVIQTHISSPRATAYLATLLSENDQIFALLTFGAGKRKAEYENYFSQLRVNNIMVFSQKLCDMDPTANILEQVCAVFVNPPNSYSAVNDPIDLVCSRGGDLAMLEILTDTADSLEGQKRVKTILEEQRLTLRYSMTRPQIQFVLYETHSQLGAENEDMVTQVIQEINRAAQFKHAELLGKVSSAKLAELRAISSAATLKEQEINNNEQEQEINNNELELGKDSSITVDEIKSTETTEENKTEIEEKESLETVEHHGPDIEEIVKKIQIPNTDSFEQTNLPDLCFNADKCLSLTEEGCYLALCQRKEVTRFDAKYMIKMAESRGLFGGNASDQQKSKQKTSRTRKKEAADANAPIKRKRGVFEVERISAQTHSSMMRSCSHALRAENGEITVHCCPKHHIDDDDRPKIPPARLWWAETARYLNRLKKSLIKQKKVTETSVVIKAINKEKINCDINNIDEILKLNLEERKKGANIPPFPRLRLTRSPTKIQRQPFPVYIKSVKLSPDDDDEYSLDEEFEI